MIGAGGDPTRFTVLPNKGGHLDPVNSFTIAFSAYIHTPNDGYLVSYNEGGVGVRLRQEDRSLVLSVPPRDADKMESRYEVTARNVLRDLRWNYIAATYNAQTGVAVIYVDNVVKAQKNLGQHVVATEGDVRIMGVYTAFNCLRFVSGAKSAQGVRDLETCPIGKLDDHLMNPL